MFRGVGSRYTFKDFPYSSHRVLAELVGNDPARILDAGAASGFLGRTLTPAGHTVVGVERDAQAASEAAPYYAAMHVLDLEDLPLLPEAPFDVIVAGDVLEHVAEPEAVLKRLVTQLAAGGRVLICAPNVAFLWIRAKLLFGRFDYEERGIMDLSHLRFLTRRTLLAIVREAGLQPRAVIGLPPPLPLLVPGLARWPGRVALEAAAILARVRPTAFAYQFVVEAHA